MNAIKDDIIIIVEKELKSANEKFPLFNSPHEGYAVIREEYDECFDELTDIYTNAEALWKRIKGNVDCNQAVKDIYKHAVNLAIESVQVAAMAQKYIISMNDKEVTEKLEDILDREEQRIKGEDDCRIKEI